jgi:hypothetical protein
VKFIDFGRSVLLDDEKIGLSTADKQKLRLLDYSMLVQGALKMVVPKSACDNFFSAFAKMVHNMTYSFMKVHDSAIIETLYTEAWWLPPDRTRYEDGKNVIKGYEKRMMTTSIEVHKSPTTIFQLLTVGHMCMSWASHSRGRRGRDRNDDNDDDDARQVSLC